MKTSHADYWYSNSIIMPWGLRFYRWKLNKEGFPKIVQYWTSENTWEESKNMNVYQRIYKRGLKP